ncbi:hypothetical protein MLP_09790 [Microlunatus phosphovorus NM-1]|uniref:Uncharacterized protein n=1 Tax=Microlunatus phosphovorus (strain ATCC 700054 / DSM 10555 / JCM 9379 / NBRC 101784 / NCIMB 13414 / VKM Ac-1990 / NM-1) TaxID=1032480 RepID=F5XMS0_MICPN|nr:hypothetical protein [Microlunatus phosphovorus]BAK33993.1 hypothetical protein MLP_09790 [Microlunatus phosphovorus NM-1]
MKPRADARNRAIRTFLQGLAFDVLAASILVLLPVIANAKSLADFDWAVLGFLFGKTIAVAVLSYVMRFFGLGKVTTPNGTQGVAQGTTAPIAPVMGSVTQ